MEEGLIVTTEQPTREYKPGLSDCIDSSCADITNHSIYYYIQTGINGGLFFLFIILTILGIWLIYRKHKGEKGLWKRIVKWESIFILTMVAVWLIANLIIYYIRSIPVPAMPA